MRKLTLDEKISIKGILSKYMKVNPAIDMKEALYAYHYCKAKSILYFNTTQRAYEAQKTKEFCTKRISDENKIPLPNLEM